MELFAGGCDHSNTQVLLSILHKCSIVFRRDEMFLLEKQPKLFLKTFQVTLFKDNPNPGIRRSGIQGAGRIPIIVLLLKL